MVILCLTSGTVLNIVRPIIAVQRILSCEHLMPLRVTEKSIREDLMETLGNTTSHMYIH